MRRIFAILLCVCICMTMPLCAFAEETPTEPDKSQYEDGVLGWLEGIFDGFASLPSRIWEFLKAGFDSVVSAIESLSFPDITALFDGFDFTPVTDFFTTAWEQISTGFGLKDFIEGPDSPFAWLSGAASVDDDDDSSLSIGILSAFHSIGTVTSAIPSDVVMVFSLIFCAALILAALKAF